uniref:Uncharacterized protein n=1 Tax=Arundo donax TaxID=35708 RepID=A0A0A9FLP8_ARUDO
MVAMPVYIVILWSYTCSRNLYLMVVYKFIIWLISL